MPQIKLKKVVGVPTELLAGELIVTDTAVGLQIGNAVNEAQEVSILHIGPDQPLGYKKVWIDTTDMTIKYNNGSAWVTPSNGVTQGVDFGEFL